MTQYSRVERSAATALSMVMSTRMPIPPRRDVYPQCVADVTSVTDLTASYRRVTLAAEEFGPLQLMGPDEYLGLYLPKPDVPLTMPDNEIDPRKALSKVAEEVRPALRWYTARAHRPDTGEIDIDIVNVDHGGPGSEWIARVAPGDKVGVRIETSLYACAPPGGRHVLLADETGVPGMLAVLDHAKEVGVVAHLTTFVEVPDTSFVSGELESSGALVVYRNENQPGSALLEALRSAELDDVDFAWVCAESGATARAKSYLVKEVGVPRRRVTSSGFWIQGKPRP